VCFFCVFVFLCVGCFCLVPSPSSQLCQHPFQLLCAVFFLFFILSSPTFPPIPLFPPGAQGPVPFSFSHFSCGALQVSLHRSSTKALQFSCQHLVPFFLPSLLLSFVSPRWVSCFFSSPDMDEVFFPASVGPTPPVSFLPPLKYFARGYFFLGPCFSRLFLPRLYLMFILIFHRSIRYPLPFDSFFPVPRCPCPIDQVFAFFFHKTQTRSPLFFILSLFLIWGSCFPLGKRAIQP